MGPCVVVLDVVVVDGVGVVEGAVVVASGFTLQLSVSQVQV